MHDLYSGASMSRVVLKSSFSLSTPLSPLPLPLSLSVLSSLSLTLCPFLSFSLSLSTSLSFLSMSLSLSQQEQQQRQPKAADASGYLLRMDARQAKTLQRPWRTSDTYRLQMERELRA